MKQATMNEDIFKYGVYVLSETGKLMPAKWIYNTAQYDHWKYQLHHFIRKSIRKNNPQLYGKIEHLQKLILVPAQMNYDLEIMGEDRFKKKWKLNKHDIVFNRLKWREGYYD